MSDDSADQPVAEGAVINVLVVDDHTVFATTLAHVLDDEPGIRIIATAGSEAAGLAAMTADVDVVLTDFRLPDGNGTSLTRKVRAQWPNVAVVMLTASNDEALMVEAMDAGCCGFITKADSLDLVISSVRRADAGEAVISPSLLARVLPRLASRGRGPNPDLTPREREVLRLMAKGGSNQAIADELFVARDTIRNHVASILSKLNASSKLDAVTTALQRGLITLEDDSQ
jgi:DNA-binding NarL/FixJ family response regulator